MNETKMYTGGCHCGAVRFEVKLGLEKVISCNCSICVQTGLLLVFTPADQFTLICGEDDLSDYLFNRKRIHHLFCSNCGVRSFASSVMPDGTEMRAINVRCLDDVDISTLTLTPIDGKNM